MSIKNYDIPMMQTALIWAKQSHCKKRQVGAILARDGRTICNGYNGTDTGKDNDCEEVRAEEEIQERQNMFNYMEEGESKYRKIYLKTKTIVTHAESNLIEYALEKNINMQWCTIYVTTQPCLNCSKKIRDAGISKVVYLDSYKNSLGTDYLLTCGISVIKLNSCEL